MNEIVVKSRVRTKLSNGLDMSISVYDNGTAMIVVETIGTSTTLHFSKEDVEVVIDGLHGGPHA